MDNVYQENIYEKIIEKSLTELSLNERKDIGNLFLKTINNYIINYTIVPDIYEGEHDAFPIDYHVYLFPIETHWNSIRHLYNLFENEKCKCKNHQIIYQKYKNVKQIYDIITVFYLHSLSFDNNILFNTDGALAKEDHTIKNIQKVSCPLSIYDKENITILEDILIYSFNFALLYEKNEFIVYNKYNKDLHFNKENTLEELVSIYINYIQLPKTIGEQSNLILEACTIISKLGTTNDFILFYFGDSAICIGNLKEKEESFLMDLLTNDDRNCECCKFTSLDYFRIPSHVLENIKPFFDTFILLTKMKKEINFEDIKVNCASKSINNFIDCLE